MPGSEEPTCPNIPPCVHPYIIHSQDGVCEVPDCGCAPTNVVSTFVEQTRKAEADLEARLRQHEEERARLLAGPHPTEKADLNFAATEMRMIVWDLTRLHADTLRQVWEKDQTIRALTFETDEQGKFMAKSRKHRLKFLDHLRAHIPTEFDDSVEPEAFIMSWVEAQVAMVTRVTEHLQKIIEASKNITAEDGSWNRPMVNAKQILQLMDLEYDPGRDTASPYGDFKGGE